MYDIAGPPTASLEQVQVKGRYVKIIGATTLDLLRRERPALDLRWKRDHAIFRDTERLQKSSCDMAISARWGADLKALRHHQGRSE